ncbi:hypothetical protein AeMF1_003933 [Aphanomyces euteiches]|nr:hypothetical protein AeMF1_003933 [Aphanomyces euteiches]
MVIQHYILAPSVVCVSPKFWSETLDDHFSIDCMRFMSKMAKEYLTSELDEALGRQVLFQRALFRASEFPKPISPEVCALAERKGYQLMQANTTRIDTSLSLQREIHGIKLYAKTLSNGDAIVQGVASVPGTVAAVLGIFKMSTSELFTETMHSILPSIASQCATVATNGRAINMHWISMINLSREQHYRDMTFLSATQYFQHARMQDDEGSLYVATTNQDRAVCGTHIWESIEVPSLKQFSPSDTRCKRETVMNSGFFVDKASDDTCRVSFTIASINDPMAWIEIVVLSALQKLITICRSMQLIPQERWANAPTCHLCDKSFHYHTMRRRHHCRLCGHSICGTCSTFVTMELMESVRCCLLCAFEESQPSGSKTPTPRMSYAPTLASTFRDSTTSIDWYRRNRTSSVSSVYSAPDSTNDLSDESNARQARRAAMLERSASYLKLAITKPSPMLQPTRARTPPPTHKQQHYLLEEFGLMSH